MLGLGLVGWFDSIDSPMTLNYTPYAGTGVVSQTGTTLTGIGSAFLSEVKVGDLITATAISENVVSIASDSILTLSGSLSSGAGLTYTITPVAGSSDRVAQWNDLSGYGNHATQATASVRPGLLAGASGVGGRSAISFDGANDVLAAVGGFTAFSGSDIPFTMISAFRRRALADDSTVMSLSKSNAASTLHNMTVSSGDVYRSRRVDDAVTAVSVDNVTPTGVIIPVVVSIVFYGTTVDIYVNGALSISGAQNVGAFTVDQLSLGASFANSVAGGLGIVDEAAVLLVNRVATTRELQQAHRYLGRRFGVVVAA